MVDTNRQAFYQYSISMQGRIGIDIEAEFSIGSLLNIESELLIYSLGTAM